MNVFTDPSEVRMEVYESNDHAKGIQKFGCRGCAYVPVFLSVFLNDSFTEKAIVTA